MSIQEIEDPEVLEFRRRAKTAIYVLLIVTVYSGLLLSYQHSFLPAYLRSLDLNHDDVTFPQSLVLAFGSLGAIVGTFIFGYIGMWLNVRYLIIATNLSSVVTVLLFGYSNLIGMSDWRYVWVIVFNFLTGVCAGNLVLVRIFISTAIGIPEIRAKILGYVSAVFGCGAVAATILVKIGSFAKKPNESDYEKRAPIFDENTLVIYLTAFLGIGVAVAVYRFVFDLSYAEEFRAKRQQADDNVDRRTLARTLSKPAIKTEYRAMLTKICWTGAMLLNFIWLIKITLAHGNNLSNVLMAEYNYTESKSTSKANSLSLYSSLTGIGGYVMAGYLMHQTKPHYALFGGFTLSFCTYWFILPVYSSENLFYSNISTAGCIYSWCDGETKIPEWCLYFFQISQRGFASLVLVTVTAAHASVVSLENQHRIHQTIFTAFGNLGTLISPLLILNVFSQAGMLVLVIIEISLMAVGVVFVIFFTVMYSYFHNDIEANNELKPIKT